MNIIDFGTGFDWFTPLSAFFRDWHYGPPADFGIMAGVWDRGDIRRLLGSYGIRAWGLIYSGDLLMFSVNEAQAAETYEILQQAGVVVLYAPEAVAK
jgi:hypothetical protein